MRRAGSGAIASTWSSPRSTHRPSATDVRHRRPRPARTRLQPPRAGGAGPHRPSSLSRPAAAGGRHRARDPARNGEIAPAPSARVHASGARRRCPTSVGARGGPSRMTLNDGFDRTVSDWLDEQAGRGAPGYLDEVLARTTRTRQRPAWSSLERWLPMHTTLRLAPVPQDGLAPRRPRLVRRARRRGPIGLGSRDRFRRRSVTPATEPWCTATDGDILSLDTATNRAHDARRRSGRPTQPALSRDGTKFVFDPPARRWPTSAR